MNNGLQEAINRYTSSLNHTTSDKGYCIEKKLNTFHDFFDDTVNLA